MHGRRSYGALGRIRGGAALFTATGALIGCSSSESPVSFETGSAEELKMAERISVHYLEERIAPEEVDVRGSLRVKQVFVDELAMAHTRVQQFVREVPVFGGEAIVHLNRDGSLFRVTDSFVRRIPRVFDTRPVFKAEEAVDLALADYDCIACLTRPPTADLWVLRRGGDDRLVYRVALSREDGTDHTEMPVRFIDAKTGEKVWEYNNLQTATGTGKSLYSGQVSFETYYNSSDGTYYLEDPTKQIGTYDNANTSDGGFTRYPDADNTWDSAAQAAGVEAHHGAAMVYDYFKNEHERDGIDGVGGPGVTTSMNGTTKLISSKVHYGEGYNNAFWNGSYMTYGDGDGDAFSSLVTLDICGHEMMHGITEKTAKLINQGEPGALNESWSDVFGAMVERFANGENEGTWRIGEQCFTPGNGTGDALRYMDDPHKAMESGFTVDDDPDHYSERYEGEFDNGGVHINSGIPNKAFYLLAKGGTHHLGGSMDGIGADEAARIWYKALTTFMTGSTSFSGARKATLNAAEALFGAGSKQVAAVGKAWTLVGVTGSGGSLDAEEASLCGMDCD